jgi:hypothetical protein
MAGKPGTAVVLYCIVVLYFNFNKQREEEHNIYPHSATLTSVSAVLCDSHPTFLEQNYECQHFTALPPETTDEKWKEASTRCGWARSRQQDGAVVLAQAGAPPLAARCLTEPSPSVSGVA